MERIVILGAGHVGSHCAASLAARGIGNEIVLVDIEKEKAAAQALDIADSLSLEDHAAVVRAGEYSDCEGAALVVVAIGEPRLPGQTRLDLLDRSVVLLDVLIKQLQPYTITCPIVSITNPCDVVAAYLREALQKERWQCFGTGTLLDTARLVRILSEDTGVSRRSINAFALGEHGDSSLAALTAATIGGQPFDSFGLDRDSILDRTRQAGMHIIIGKGSTEFGIGRALCALAQCVLRDEKRVMPLSVALEGEYGQCGVNCGVPCLVGKNGIEKIVQLTLNETEQAQLDRSCEIIKTHMARAKAVHAANL